VTLQKIKQHTRLLYLSEPGASFADYLTRVFGAYPEEDNGENVFLADENN